MTQNINRTGFLENDQLSLVLVSTARVIDALYLSVYAYRFNALGFIFRLSSNRNILERLCDGL